MKSNYINENGFITFQSLPIIKTHSTNINKLPVLLPPNLFPNDIDNVKTQIFSNNKDDNIKSPNNSVINNDIINTSTRIENNYNPLQETDISLMFDGMDDKINQLRSFL